MRFHLYKIFLFFLFSSLYSYERASSYPYLSGDTWRFFANWRLSTVETFNPVDVQEGDVIFVEYDLLGTFGQKYLPEIQHHFILMTPNCESGTDNPQPGRYASFLNSEKIAAWFVQNIDRAPSEKLIPIPIGFANQVWPHGQISVLDPIASNAPPPGSDERDLLLYINFRVDTNRHTRDPCLRYFRTLSCATIQHPSQSFKDYLQDFTRSVFTVSPPGNGQDCHRTWEALIMGCYPIVLSSSLNPLYEGLPIVIIKNWDEITEEFLQKKREEFKSKSWNFEKLYAPYWFQKVFAIQQQLRE